MQFRVPELKPSVSSKLGCIALSLALPIISGVYCIICKRNFSQKKEEEKIVNKLHEFVVIAFICTQARTGMHTRDKRFVSS